MIPRAKACRIVLDLDPQFTIQVRRIKTPHVYDVSEYMTLVKQSYISSTQKHQMHERTEPVAFGECVSPDFGV